jgi:UDP-3-O-[3-hydroxymyristoyl] glucosamine N-acyltransferase
VFPDLLLNARDFYAGIVYGTSVADSKGVTIHLTAVVEDGAEIGHGTRIWHHAQVRESARIGAGCILGKNVYADAGVTVGDNSLP